MTTTAFSYDDLFRDFRNYLLEWNPTSTHEITRSIKDYFNEKYSDEYSVLCSQANGSEFLLDVMVTTFDPKAIIEINTLNISADDFSVLIGVESELGGVGASSAYGVMKNVVEDYLKLLLANARHRVMVFTSLPYAKEENHIESRIETLRVIYQRTTGVSGGALLIHLAGSQPRSTQVQAQVSATSIRGYIVSSDGKSVAELNSSSC
ncbi:hypothetical protein CLG94_06495 [Candidatus Methylomirabilis limnetica]|uniref:Uncharacterized protein n=2 Tax=Candidatus Methylomirabilis limnetica TaxID=2033718 RepID=A0A2T4TY66_9BACT|nr:hypothetical protein CLG94_06495 [Candidatus Methylomirabilis limnetica]